MISAEGEKKIKKLLISKIKIAIEWDGRVPDNLVSAYDVAEKFEYLYPLDEALNSIASSLRHTDPENKTIYNPLHTQANNLKNKVIQEAQKIVESIDRINGNDESIKEKYIEDVAKKFIRDNKKECVLIAPDLWLPTI